MSVMAPIPAIAAQSDQRVVTLSGPSGIPANRPVPLTTTVTNTQGAPLTGIPVSLSPDYPGTLVQASGVTDGTGTFTTQYAANLPWVTPGTKTTVSTVAGGSSASQAFTLLGANALGFGLDQWTELGDGGTPGDSGGQGAARSTPTQTLCVFSSPIVQMVTVGAVGQGPNHSSFALLQDGTVWSVGGNNYAQLGDGTRTDRSTWERVSGASGVVQLSAANETVFGLLPDGTVVGWGSNFAGVLGTGHKSDVSWVGSAQPVAGLSDIVQIGSGTQQAFFLRGDGTVWATGRNTFSAALGNTSVGDQSAAPVQVGTLTDITLIAGSHQGGYALKSDGTVWAWGSNYAGVMGDGTTPVPPPWSPGAPVYASATPAQVQGLPGRVTQLAGSFAGGVALVEDGTVWTWGDNSSGFVGGSDTAYSTATARGLSDVIQITASGGSGYALKSDGTVWAWGANDYGQLGDGTTSARSTPVQVAGLSGIGVASLMKNSPSTKRMFLVTSLTTMTVQMAPQLAAGSSVPVTVTVQSSGVGIAGVSVSLSVNGSGSLSASSGTTDSSGAFSTTLSVASSVAAGNIVRVSAASTSCAASGQLTVLNANLLSFGGNLGNELGDGLAASARSKLDPGLTSPVFASVVRQAVTSGSPNTDAGGRTSFALLADGSMWGIGGGSWGQLGVNGTQGSAVWVNIPLRTSVQQIAMTNLNGVALLTDGTVWAWGNNAFGQLADGTLDYKSSPVQIPGLPERVVQIAASEGNIYALLADGSVRAWGSGNQGRRGDGSTASHLGDPVAVQLPPSVKATAIGVSSATGMAVLEDGTVWAWGNNSSGTVGDGTTTNRTIPVQVSGLPTDVSAFAGGQKTAYALTSSGDVWGWGAGDRGQLGNGTTMSVQSTPAKIPGLSNVRQISSGILTGYALLGDGSVRSWGANSVLSVATNQTLSGQLGDGGTADSSVPVSVSLPNGLTVSALAVSSSLSDRMFLITR